MVRKPKCRYCKTNRYVIPMVYGVKYDERLLEKEKKGEVKFGAGYIGVDRPNWHCKRCGYEFLK